MLLCMVCMGAWADVVDETKVYTLQCKSTAHTGYIFDDNGSITSQGDNFSIFRFIKQDDGKYYIQSATSGKYINASEIASKKPCSFDADPSTKWEISQCTYTGCTDYIVIRPEGTNDLGLNNNGTSPSYLQVGPCSSNENACSIWKLQEFPFVYVEDIDQISKAKWYKLRVNANDYVVYNPTFNWFGWKNSAPTDGNGYFAFIGNPNNGFKIYNYAAGMAITSTNVNTDYMVRASFDDEANTYKLKKFTNSSGAVSWQFEDITKTNARLNHLGGGLGYWVNDVQYDGGNSFYFFEAEGISANNYYVYNVTANNEKGNISWKTGKFSNEGPTTNDLPNVSYIADYAIGDRDGHNVTVTASHTMPMIPGRIYQLKYGSTYVKHNSDAQYTLKATSNQFSKSNLWYVETCQYGPYFYLMNKENQKAVCALSDGNTSSCVSSNVLDRKHKSGGMVYEKFTYEFVKNNNKFRIYQAKSNDNLGAHGSDNDPYPDGSARANSALGKWGISNRNGGTDFEVEDVTELYEDLQTKIDVALSNSGKVGYPTDMSSLNSYASTGVTDANICEAASAYYEIQNSTEIKLPEAGHVYSIMAYFKDNQNSGRYVTNASGTTISAPTDLATNGTAYWLYTDGKFKNSANAVNYIAGAENTNMSVNTSGTAFTMVKGLEFGTICIKGGQSHHAINTDGTFGRFTGEDKRQNSGTGYTTDFMIVEIPYAYFAETSTGDNPIYYSIKNVRQQKFVATSDYGNSLAQVSNLGLDACWYFENAGNDVNVDRTIYQPVYIRTAKYGGYLSNEPHADGEDNVRCVPMTITTDAQHKGIFYLWKWDNGANNDNNLCISRTAEKTTNSATRNSRNSWADKDNQGNSICYYQSQDPGTNFKFTRISNQEQVSSLVAAFVTGFTDSDDYVGDYPTASVSNASAAKTTYNNAQTVVNLNALREAYTQDFYWATTAPVRRAISTDKYYVIESAHTGFTTSGTYVLRASSDNANNKIRWGAYDSNDIKSVWRFDKLVEGATVNESAGTNWGSVNGTYDIYSLYNVGRQTEGFIGISTYNNPVEFKNSASLRDTYRPADNSHAAAFAVVPVEANSSKFNILCNYYTGEDTRDNFTLAVSTDASVTATSGNATCRNAWGTTPSDPTLSQWKIREVSAPTAPTQNVAISSVGVATFYTGKTLEIPEGVTAKKVVDAQDPQQGDVYHLVYEELQDEIPAGTPVVLFGDENPSYQFPRSLEPHDYVVTSAAGSAENRLIGTLNNNDEATGYGENGTLYALGKKNDLVAFYHFLSETLTAGKAYLDASGLGVAGSSVRAFAIFDEGTDTITCIDAVTGATIDKGTAFDLAGRRVNANVKGISIVNGKKVIR